MSQSYLQKGKTSFDLLIKNKTTKEIALELNISENSYHISNVMQKLGVRVAQAVVELLRLNEFTL